MVAYAYYSVEDELFELESRMAGITKEIWRLGERAEEMGKANHETTVIPVGT